jgi:hypothetical protein
MLTYLAEGFVAISILGSMSLLAGLLRAAKAAAQVGEDVPAHPAANDEGGPTGQQRNGLDNLIVAF